MIKDGEKWHYLQVKKLSGLLKVIKIKHDGDLKTVLNSIRTKNKLKKYENVCKNHDYCYIEMSKKGKDILKYNHGEKSMKFPFIIYAATESLLGKIDICHSNYYFI